MARKRPKLVGRAPGRAQAAPEEDDEGQDDREGAEQAQLLADHREDEVAVRVGQVEELLAALHQADAGDAAGAHRDQALDDLVAGARGSDHGLKKVDRSAAAPRRRPIAA